MGQLRFIPFERHYFGNTCGILRMFTEGHDAHVEHKDGANYVNCSCGGKWKVSPRKGIDLDDETEATFNAHLSYATRPAIKPD